MRIVVKIGSALLTNNGQGLDRTAISDWVAQMGALVQAGHQVVLVSSGAIAEGVKRLGLAKRPTEIDQLQAAAAVGQMGLAQLYESLFGESQLRTAQILLTHEDLADRTRYLNAKNTLNALLAWRVVPVINENDTVVTDEIKFGDNDTLGALVTNLIYADLLIILTDQPGLFTADPRKDASATMIKEARASDTSLQAMAGGAGSSVGKGGMITKVLAAKRAAMSGAATVIATGREVNVLTRIAAGEAVGTKLIADASPVAARKQWLAGHLQTSGKIVVDAGCVKALTSDGKSLLPIGAIAIEGNFSRGEVVKIASADGIVIAHGLSNFSAADARRIVGLPSSSIAQTLGYEAEAELVHRDNLALV
jgi:glutamate 5-kinase